MRHIVIHGHFYQPPRENPWTERVPREPSAGSYHDWNARIRRECYAPNCHARLLGAGGRISELVNNYEFLSFNFGATLIDWLQSHDPDTVQSLREADRRAEVRTGHGNAMAQVYGHAILPLLTSRDKETQVRWGLAHFRHTFGRDAQGMWLSETAADPATLDVLAECGVKFTVLAPWQLVAYRGSAEGSAWVHPESREALRRAFRYTTPSGRELSLFFYDGELGQKIAFGDALKDGEAFAQLLRGTGTEREESPDLIHVATDGESYGHHHRFGDMALAAALDRLVADPDVTLTNYASFLAEHPPSVEAQILDPGSWSCAHGVERWRSDCGCSTGGEPGWTQAWRAPLFESLVFLRDALDAQFSTQGDQVFHDPWKARDAYIDVLLDPTPQIRAAFVTAHVADPQQVELAWRLLEQQRHRLLMFTSCGWFFNDLAGIETLQILRYAGRALDLSDPAARDDLEREFLRRLGLARSNRAPFPSGAELFQRAVGRARIQPAAMAAEAALRRRFDISSGVGDSSTAFSVEFDSPNRDSGRMTLTHRHLQTRTQYGYTTTVDESPTVSVRLSPVEALDDHEDLEVSLQDLDPDAAEVVIRRVLERVERRAAKGMVALASDFDVITSFLESSHVAPPQGLKHLLESAWLGALLDELETAGASVSATWVDRLQRFDTLGLARDDARLLAGAERRLAEVIASWVGSAEEEAATLAFNLLDVCDTLAPTPDLWEAQNALFPAWSRQRDRSDVASTLMRLADRLGFVLPPTGD